MSRIRLAAPVYKGTLAVHIIATGAWIGIDVVMGVLVFTAMSTVDSAVRMLCLQVLQLVTVWPMLASGAVSLLSGLLLGLGTKYGIVRYWWVLIKLILNLVLMVLVFFSLRPGVAEVAKTGIVGDMVFPPIVSTSTLLFAAFISVYKPWGRIRRRRL
ncbi:hypothetical protein [Allorhizocola rhizosphaerae]|uniref:hypothetical protein n=1 Tax=Allorhizocola rhizosphaerae TaxID=1872709 RepID=UPI001B8BDC37|nr:hypothetical protein [Allorhizocola rhizosphaerae]